ncbi:tRNA (adenosine(37)-N6)-dimethylallyltransferase MiaA [Phaeovulum sp. NW3]|uniref:tRNA (adenosine(37)-N6)-dimethylallyltransferase MiaA n=1 Tax=Phaeovulum sp. NW3 TaxID=2934933 RepID=UPI0020228F67|nr:tRNA (adenosine(37)-N6)-dimethylallyltransferase MiaA [Phaeovulum sp. NW3]MCL7463906.1 tRNA (adenosine(37)-N6)-dimethylallyltransferase MiaA [Phaeovulum sp. NW3]
MTDILEDIDPGRPVLIAGPTASGKSDLALAIARAQGGVVINADALQVWSCWRVLTARPSAADEAAAPHALYGHVHPGQAYSVGHWLREVAALLTGGIRPIIVGGTGLYLSALTEGLANIPAIPADLRTLADRRMAAEGPAALLAELDPATRTRIDPLNPARIQRAWEVLAATGQGLASWQAQTPPPLLPLTACAALLIEADRDWLADRIDRRFDRMLAEGALEEVRAMLPLWDPAAPWAKAIGAPELVAHLHGALSPEAARFAAQAASRQYAKRQRTWFRSRMGAWHKILRP